ncbi:MAG: tetratricopeptide repeat protein [Ignavibacteria bacterium]|jgi:Tfp pilus assembly protein PilF|nr:tetratricopeptide repeat protein [Ignavibacteria bacterium]MCU7504242.1 tetratricopeptide repeat protein [Ignavibacteria bacterium]MCU7516087.1 tetratricopeptide repeat protein [Ignavibacteria bacterium]
MINNSNRLDIAQEYFNKAYKSQMEGRLDEAIDYYKISIDLFPTAEAHTFLGWAYSVKGKYEDAIDECYIAIEIDENYGNPYNDIGEYLINLKRYEEAIIWLEKAINAPRYSLRHFPYYNLGRIYEKKGEWFKALSYYKDAANLNPDFDPAKKAIIRVTTLLN